MFNIKGYREYQGNFKKKRNGEGTNYYENGNIHYQGEWVDDKCHGKGIGYHENGDIQYEGEWKDDKANGQGIYYEDGIKDYQGNFKRW